MILLLDAHSHLYSQFPLDIYLQGAWENFNRLPAARQAVDWTGCLFVAETAASRVHGRLEQYHAGREGADSGGWELVPTAERTSWVARHPEGRELLLILGRQLRAEGGIEVLQVGTLDTVSEPGIDLVETVGKIRSAGGFSVLPWGFGKWTLRRKRFLLECLESWEPGQLALADSAGRPAIFPDHPVLARARELGFPVLGGTDPFPFSSHARRSGGLATALDVSVGKREPWSELRRKLVELERQPRIVGERDRLPGLVANQIKLVIR